MGKEDYDNQNQQIGFTRGSHSRSWDYDAQGNWQSVTTDGSTQTRTHNAQNEITSISGAVTPTYDANGNLTRDETGRQFVYDAWNRLVAVKDAGGTTLKSYTYDGLHRRVQETASGTTTDLYYSDAWQVLEERVGGQTMVQYVWSPVYVDALILRDRDTNGDGTLDERLWVVQDANYNVTALVDNSGNVVERYLYDPFGRVTVVDGGWVERSEGTAFAWHYLHQGGRYDDVSGLYHFRFRDYSPTLGRWTSLDPLRYDAEDVNLYRALGNNTLIRFDPYGLEWSWGGAIGGMFSGGIVGAGVGATVGAPFFGIGALPGAIAGGAVGAIGGFIAGGALTEPAYTAITGNPDPQLSFWEEFGMGFVIGIPVGVVAGIVGPAGWSLYTGAFWTSTTAYYLGLAAPGATMTVSHWGKPGVGPGSWVMVGRPDWLSWLLAGGPQVGPYSSGLAYQVPIQSVVTPYGGGAPWYEWIKFWQRMII